MSRDPQARYATAQALALVAVVSSVAAVWINSARGKVVTAQQAEAKQLQIALRNEKDAKRHQGIAENNAAKAEAAAMAEKQAKEEEAKQRILAITAADDEKKQRLLAEQETKRANDEAERGRRQLYVAHMNLAQPSWDSARVGETMRLLDLYRPQMGQEKDPKDLRGFEWFYWDRLCRSDLVTLKGHTDQVWSVAFSADGKRLASASGDQTVKVWDARPWTPELRAEREALSLIHLLRDQGQPQSAWLAESAARVSRARRIGALPIESAFPAR